MKELINWCLQKRIWVLSLTLVFCGIGLFVIEKIPVDAVPDITNKQVMINTKTGSLSPIQIEREVTLPLELELNGIPGAQEIRSLSKYGLSQVTIIFDDSVDIYWARSQVFERINMANLPDDLSPELAPITTGLGEVVMYTLHTEEDSPLNELSEIDKLMELRLIQERIVRPSIRRIPGVADVDTTGGYSKQIHINILPKKLLSFGLSLLDLKEALDNMGRNVGGSYIEEGGNQIVVGINNELIQLKDIENFPIKMDFQGKWVKVSDVATVKIEPSLRIGAATSNGREVVLGTVLMQSGANSRNVAKDSVSKLLSLDLPNKVKIDIEYSRSFLVDATIETVTKNLIEGALLVIFVLLLLVGNLRSALLVSSVIPISLLGAFIGMKITGVSANLMSLGAIDFGLIVDGTVVMVENMVRRSQLKTNNIQESNLSFYLSSCLEVIRPVIFGVLIIMIVYIPVLFLTGIEGKMFQPMAITVLLALATSLILTITFIPAAASLFLNLKESHKKPWLFSHLENYYLITLKWAFKHRTFVISSSLILLGLSSYLIYFKVGSDFIPQLNEGDMVIGLVRDSKQGLRESIKQQQEAEKIILQNPEVEKVFSRMGAPDSGSDPMSVNFADTFVILKKDKHTWTLNPTTKNYLSKDELFLKIKKDLEKLLPPQDISQTQPIEMRFNEILEGSRADVTLRYYGPDLSVLSDLIDQSEKVLEGLDGLSEAQLDSLTALTKSEILEIRPIPEKMARYSVVLKDLGQAFSLALSGYQIGVVYEHERTLPIILHLDEFLREKVTEIQNLPVPTLKGGVVPLHFIAELHRSERVTTIARSWGQRYSALSMFVKNRDLGSFVKDAQKLISSQIHLPKDYNTYWGGQFRNLTEARSRFAILVPVTLFFILFLLYQNFSCIKESLIVFSVIPLASVGGVFSLWIRGYSLTVPAIIGFIALSGVAVLNGVVLMSFISELRKSGTPINEAIFNGAQTRLRPVVMTALVAGLGFLPMAFNQGLGTEVQKPLATVVIGGIVSATLLTLIIVPIIISFVFSKNQN